MDAITMGADANSSETTMPAPFTRTDGTTRDRIQSYLSLNRIEIFTDQSQSWDFNDCETLEERFDCGLMGLEQLRSETVEAAREGNERALVDTVTGYQKLHTLVTKLVDEAEQTSLDSFALHLQDFRAKLGPRTDDDTFDSADRWEGVAWRIARRRDDMLAQLDTAQLLMEKQCVFAKFCWSVLSWDAGRIFRVGQPQGALWSDGFEAGHFVKLQPEDNRWAIRMKWTAFKGATRRPTYILLEGGPSGGEEQTMVQWEKIDAAAVVDDGVKFDVEVRLRNTLFSNLRVDVAGMFKMMEFDV